MVIHPEVAIMYRQLYVLLHLVVFYIYGQDVENITLSEHEFMAKKQQEDAVNIFSAKSEEMVTITSLTTYENIYEETTNIIAYQDALNGQNNIILPLKYKSNIENHMMKLYREFEYDSCLIIPYDKSLLDCILPVIRMKTIIYPESRKILMKKLRQFHSYIILLETIQDLKHFLTMLYGSPNWSYRAKYLLIYHVKPDDMEEIFKITFKYLLVDISILILHEQSFEVYTHFPYIDGSCGSNWTPVKISDNSNIFPEKIDLDLKGCEIRIMGVGIKPYVVDITQPKDDPAKAGLEITIIHNVVKKMNFTEIYVPNPYTNWGFLMPDGTFTMTYKSLADGDVDVVFGMIVANETIVDTFTSTLFHIQITSTWVVPIASQVAQWKNLTVIFDGIVWASIFFVWILNGFTWWFIGRNREPSTSYNELSLCMMGSLYMLLQGSFTTANAWKLRFVVCLWSVASLLLFTAHQCELTGILTSPLYEHQISNLKELAESNLQFGLHPQLTSLYTDLRNPVHRKIRRNLQECSLYPVCVNRTAFQRDFATIKNRREIAYLMPLYYTTPAGKPMVFMFKHTAIVSPVKYFMAKGFPFIKRVDTILLRLLNAGMMEKWDADLSSNMKVEDDAELEPLSLNHLQAAFYLLLFGFLLSGCTFLGEKCYKRFEKKETEVDVIEDIFGG